MEFSWTYQADESCVCLMVAGIPKKIYHDRPGGLCKALTATRHSLTSLCSLLLLLAALYGNGRAYCLRGEIEPEAVNDVVPLLTGPLSGIGDSIFLTILQSLLPQLVFLLCQAGNAGPSCFPVDLQYPCVLAACVGCPEGLYRVSFLKRRPKVGPRKRSSRP